MLRKLDSDRFAFSRKACFESAKQDFDYRQKFKGSIPRKTMKSLGGGYREFQAAMISGISLAIECVFYVFTDLQCTASLIDAS